MHTDVVFFILHIKYVYICSLDADVFIVCFDLFSLHLSTIHPSIHPPFDVFVVNSISAACDCIQYA